MKKENALLMKEAREALVGKWGLAVGTFFIYILITGILNKIRNVGPVISLIIDGPLMLGLAMFSLSLSRKKDAKFEQLFEGFKRFGKSLVAYLLVIIFSILWTLLLIVPGIIAAISYSQTFFILVDDENISAGDAIKKSKKMMYGYKWKYFYLGCRFIGWLLLSILTLGIGLLWLIPYINVTLAKFYDDLKDSSVSPEVVPNVA
ncbi:MAG: DUF975 family protein [Candidatus Paceibacterota bacterium]|jgi:uncharacterized membrane protein